MIGATKLINELYSPVSLLDVSDEDNKQLKCTDPESKETDVRKSSAGLEAGISAFLCLPNQCKESDSRYSTILPRWCNFAMKRGVSEKLFLRSTFALWVTRIFTISR